MFLPQSRRSVFNVLNVVRFTAILRFHFYRGHILYNGLLVTAELLLLVRIHVIQNIFLLHWTQELLLFPVQVKQSIELIVELPVVRLLRPEGVQVVLLFAAEVALVH